jgi:non-homologous end joining protein Ku
MIAGERPYALLLETLRRTGHVGIAQWTLHSREHIVVLRPGRTGLLLHTMYYRAEVRAVDEFRTDTSGISPQELELATLLVQALALSRNGGRLLSGCDYAVHAEKMKRCRNESSASLPVGSSDL